MYNVVSEGGDERAVLTEEVVCECLTEVERTLLIKGRFGSTPAIHFLNVCAADSFKMVSQIC